LLLVQNYFSVFYPNMNTDTEGTITLFSHDGHELGRKTFQLGQHACEKIKTSSLTSELGISPEHTYGTLECRLAVPPQVLQEVGPMYFFDRFYIGYLNKKSQPTFVHGVDKTYIYREDRPRTDLWYSAPEALEWAPEMPLLMADYQRFSVIMLNRVTKPVEMALVISDWDDRSMKWEATIQPRGVHRFELTAENTAGLDPRELRMKIEGMATHRGRPLVLKEFSNSAISVMHC